MDRVDADVWILTETHSSLSPNGTGYHGVDSDGRPLMDGNRGIKAGSHWVTIWSRLPIEKIDLSRGDPRRVAAAITGETGSKVAVYGTVLPWTGDTETEGMRSVLARQVEEWTDLKARHEDRLCVAGDFNVNLGGEHFYGSNDSKEAVQEALDSTGLTAMTRYENTPGRRYGIIDHVAVPTDAAPMSELFCVWEDHDSQGRQLSDHPGAAVDIDTW
jgi:endonuclease/exonuclease/phosphatase family metal-dependent hydrolase